MYVATLTSTIVAAENTATINHANMLARKMVTSEISHDCDLKCTIIQLIQPISGLDGLASPSNLD